MGVEALSLDISIGPRKCIHFSSFQTNTAPHAVPTTNRERPAFLHVIPYQVYRSHSSTQSQIPSVPLLPTSKHSYLEKGTFSLILSPLSISYILQPFLKLTF